MFGSKAELFGTADLTVQLSNVKNSKRRLMAISDVRKWP